ncbi:hypothetical protein FRC11_009911, partial [Ceratobasidium sp. 423]
MTNLREHSQRASPLRSSSAANPGESSPYPDIRHAIGHARTGASSERRSPAVRRSNRGAEWVGDLCSNMAPRSAGTDSQIDLYRPGTKSFTAYASASAGRRIGRTTSAHDRRGPGPLYGVEGFTIGRAVTGPEAPRGSHEVRVHRRGGAPGCQRALEDAITLNPRARSIAQPRPDILARQPARHAGGPSPRTTYTATLRNDQRPPYRDDKRPASTPRPDPTTPNLRPVDVSP